MKDYKKLIEDSEFLLKDKAKQLTAAQHKQNSKRVSRAWWS